MIRWVYFIIIITCFSSANAELTIEERNWLIKNWLSIDTRVGYVWGSKVEVSFPDLSTFAVLQDDTTTYQDAYKLWVRNYCYRTGKLYAEGLYEYSKKQTGYIQRTKQLEAMQGGE